MASILPEIFWTEVHDGIALTLEEPLLSGRLFLDRYPLEGKQWAFGRKTGEEPVLQGDDFPDGDYWAFNIIRKLYNAAAGGRI